MMDKCWSPWYYYDDTRSGSFACAAVSTFFSMFSIVYVCYCLDGGESSQFFLPLFETDVKTTMKPAGGFLLGYYILFILFSGMMVLGVKRYHRGLILPWLTINMLYVLSLVAFAIWLQASYYHNLLSVLWTLLYLMYCGVHVYMHRCVRAQYEIIKSYHAPNIMQLYD